MNSLKNYFLGSEEVRAARIRLRDLKNDQKKAAANEQESNDLFFRKSALAPDKKLVHRHLMKVSAVTFVAIIGIIGAIIKISRLPSSEEKREHEIVLVEKYSEQVVTYIENMMIELSQQLFQIQKQFPSYTSETDEILAPFGLIATNKESKYKYFARAYEVIKYENEAEKAQAYQSPFFYVIDPQPISAMRYIPAKTALVIPFPESRSQNGQTLDYDDMDKIYLYFLLDLIVEDLEERSKWSDAHNGDLKSYYARFDEKKGDLKAGTSRWHVKAGGHMLEVVNLLVHNRLYEAAIKGEELNLEDLLKNFRFKNQQNRNRFKNALTLSNLYFPDRLPDEYTKQIFFEALNSTFIIKK